MERICSEQTVFLLQVNDVPNAVNFIKVQGLTLNDREWVCVCGCHHEGDENAAKNLAQYPFLDKINCAGRDDPNCVKSSPRAMDVSASALAKGALHTEVLGSQEAFAFRRG